MTAHGERGSCCLGLGPADRASHTTVMKSLAATFALLFVFSFAQTGFTDQNDKRLDILFTQLHETTDLTEGSRLTNEIWRIWHETANETIGLLLLKGTKPMSIGMTAAARGLQSASQEKFQVALSLFDKVVNQEPEFAEGWNKRATLFYAMGEYDGSIRDVERTLELEPRHFGALSGLGLINLALGDDEAALDAFQSALEVNPHLSGPKVRILEILRRREGEAI